ncbi:MAG: MauE/DoxX family redox-associated membrane protein [Desulfobacula sp.]
MNSFYRFFYHLARLVLGAVFIYASLDKILNPGAFAQAVFNYQVLPGELVNLTALILPWLELILGACLLSDRWMTGASSLTAVLMAVFMGLIFFNLARGLDISCGCFSTNPDEGPMDKLTLLRDSLFFILALCLAGLTYYKKTAHNKNQLYIV